MNSRHFEWKLLVVVGLCCIPLNIFAEVRAVAEKEPATMMEWIRARRERKAQEQKLAEKTNVSVVAPVSQTDVVKAPAKILPPAKPVMKMDDPFVQALPAPVKVEAQSAPVPSPAPIYPALINDMSPIHSQTPIKIMTSVPNLASLFEIIGGEQVSVKSYTNPYEDLARVDPQNNPRKDLEEFLIHADVFAQAGTQVESKFVQDLLMKIQTSSLAGKKRSYFTAFPLAGLAQDAAKIGNAPYLSDPLFGIQVARSIQDLLTRLRPSSQVHFQERYNQFHRQLGVALVGESIYNHYAFESIVDLYQKGQLEAFLDAHNLTYQLGGWLKTMQPHRGKKVFMDEGDLAYFEKRFGLVADESLANEQSENPSNILKRSLVFAKMQVGSRKKVVVTHENRESDFIKKLKSAPEAKIVQLASQVRSKATPNDYVAYVDQNIRALDLALTD